MVNISSLACPVLANNYWSKIEFCFVECRIYLNTYNSRLKNFSLQFKWARFEKWSDFTLLSEPFVRRFALAIVLLALYSSSQMYFWCAFVWYLYFFCICICIYAPHYAPRLTIVSLAFQLLFNPVFLSPIFFLFNYYASQLAFSSKNAAFCKLCVSA